MKFSLSDQISASEYHDSQDRSRQSRVVGQNELLKRLPWVDQELLDSAGQLFPVAITRSWMDNSEGDPNDPLLLQAIPRAEELVLNKSDLLDPVGDQACSPVPWVVQNHQDRALLLLTKRCHVYCRYCFRRAFSPGDSVDPTPAQLDNAVDWVLSSGVQEIICLLYTSPSPRDRTRSRMPSSA